MLRTEGAGEGIVCRPDAGETVPDVACVQLLAQGSGETPFRAVGIVAVHDDRVIIVLNDNGMSISKNVGGLARYLGRMRTRTTYIKLKKGVK